MPSSTSSAPAVALADLFIEVVDTPLADLQVFGLTLDSRMVSPGDLFLACRGQVHDARDHIGDAGRRGAVAAALEAGDDGEEELARRRQEAGIPAFVVDNLSKRLGLVADQFFDHPSRKMQLVGVTGTNGKTTCSQIIGQLNRTIYTQCGVIGTLGSSLTGAVEDAINTTPDAVALQTRLAAWNEAGVDQVAMEVSSHALEQGRVTGVEFDTAVFTNLTRDHLDYHGTMETYGLAKASLFRSPGLRHSVLNLDDDFSTVLREIIAPDVEVLTYSISNPRADVYTHNVRYHSAGVSAAISTPWGDGLLSSPLLGDFNLSNLLAAVTCLCSNGAGLSEVLGATVELMPIPGRMQTVTNSQNIQVIIDYAHTPDALEQVLSAIRGHTTGRLRCVFGCGGDRDRGKRAEMGTIADRAADVVIVTSDNPRGEDPNAIIEDILEGCHGVVEVCADRAQAIHLAIGAAEPGDSVVIAGKGHEDYQLVAGRKLSFSDLQVASEALLGRSGA